MEFEAAVRCYAAVDRSMKGVLAMSKLSSQIRLLALSLAGATAVSLGLPAASQGVAAPQILQPAMQGSKIAFVADRRGQDAPDEVYVMNADGTGEQQVTLREQLTFPPDCLALYPRWSPNGKQIAFTCFGATTAGPASEIWLTDGVHMTQLTTMGLQGASNPTWSPDGKQVAFSSAAGQIFVINSDGTDLRGPLINGNVPDWSPDGTRLLFQRVQSVYVIDVDDLFNHPDNLVQLTNRDSRRGYDQFPRWSPNGRQILFERSQLNSPRIPCVAVMNPNTPETDSIPECITATDGIQVSHRIAPSWSPDGHWILFQRLLCDPTTHNPINPQRPPNGQDLFAVALDANADGSHSEVRLTFGACPGPPNPGEPFGTFVPENSSFIPKSTFSAWASWAPGHVTVER